MGLLLPRAMSVRSSPECKRVPYETKWNLGRTRSETTSITDSWLASLKRLRRGSLAQSPAPQRYCQATPTVLKLVPLRAVTPELK